MRLVYVGSDVSIELNENEANVVTVEEPGLFSRIVADLIKQSQGQSGNLIISDSAKEYQIDKVSEFISSPFLINVNDKKIINSLYSQLALLAQDNLFEETLELNCEIVKFMDKLSMYSPYNSEFSTEIDISGLLKLYGFKIESCESSVPDIIINYIKALHRICHKTIFVFLNLRQYVSEANLQEIYKSAFYEKVHIVILEGFYSGKGENENHLIIDKDLCTIEV